MSTRSHIARVNEDGSLDVIYCHWDGYISGNGLQLVMYYDTKKNLDRLIEIGSISSLRDTVEETAKEHYEGEETFHYDSMDDYLASLEDSCIEYVYFAYYKTPKNAWVPDVEWRVAHYTSDFKKTLVLPNPYEQFCALDSDLAELTAE